jgi:VIT1/CCC1 family predicted Fe2+/Mn2+ transporter
MKPSLRTGLSFGLTSGVITTLGLMVGLHSGTHSRAVVLGGIVTIAVADALSDAMGIHLAEESKNRGPARHIWESTAATFAAKLCIALTFAVPVLLVPLGTAILVGLLWGLLLLALLSFFLARAQRIAPWKVIGEHLVIALCVVVLSHYLGDWIKEYAGEPR